MMPDAPMPAPAAAPVDWQPLPARGARLWAMRHAIGFGLPATLAAAGLALASAAPPWWAVPLAALLAAAFGARVGMRRYRHVLWKLDALGLSVRRGRLWQSDTFVPLTRVQHLDLTRGPLERKLRLATLVVHTAGTRATEVTVPLLDDADAEHLRAQLSRQLDLDGDAL